MLPWTLLATATIPGDGEEMRLYRRGGEFSIRVSSYELMNSRVHGSEEALAELALPKLSRRARLRILIGGLGIGYTLAAVLKLIGPRDEAVVAELVPAVVRWNRGPLAALAGRPLSDRRVKVIERDVAAVIRDGAGSFDAILLDVDTGPKALTQDSNAQLYTLPGLRLAHAALRPGGILGIWSGGSDPSFVRRMNEAGFSVEEIRARARMEHGGARYVIWLARPASRSSDRSVR